MVAMYLLQELHIWDGHLPLKRYFHVHRHICLSYLSTRPKLNDFGRSKFDFLKVIGINFDHVEANHGVPDSLSLSYQDF